MIQHLQQNAQRRGCVLVTSGPSGAGKSTVCQRLLAETPGIRFSVSCTTRAPRAGELDGRDYHFVSREVFEARVAAGEFLEHAEVHGNYYGTLAAEVLSHVEHGIDVLLDIDVQGAMQIRERCHQPPWRDMAVFAFIGPPSLEELSRRLRGRGTDAEDVIRRRLQNALEELAQWRRYDYLIVNHDVEEAVAELQAILHTQRMKTVLRLDEPWNG